eukprot:2865597-Prymnesium_polylepis.1
MQSLLDGVDEAHVRLLGAPRIARRVPVCVCHLDRHPVAHVLEQLEALADDLLERECSQVDAELAFDDDDVAVDARTACLYADPRDVGAAVDHALLHLDDDAHARPIASCVAHRDFTGQRRAHEGRLDAAPHAKLVRIPKLLWQRHARDPTVDLGRLCELAELDDRRVDAVEGRRVLVERAQRLLERRRSRCRLGQFRAAHVAVSDRLWAAKSHHRVLEEGHVRAQAAEHAVVFDKHWTRVEIRRNDLRLDEGRLLGLLELLIARLSSPLQVAVAQGSEHRLSDST